MAGRTTTLHEFAAHSSTVHCVALGKQLLATGGEDRLVNVWRTDSSGSQVHSLEAGHSSTVTALALDAGEALLASGSQCGSVKVFDLRTGKISRALAGHVAAVTALAFHPTSPLLLSGSADATLRVWDLAGKQCVLQHRGHDAPVTAAGFSPDGRWAATGGADGVLCVWEVAKPEEIFTFRADAAADADAGVTTSRSIPAVTALAFHPRGAPRLAAATTDGCVRLWDLESFELLAMSGVPGEAGPPARAMAFAATGSKLHVVSERQWRALDGAALGVAGEAAAAWQRPAAVAVAEDGEEMLVAAFNGHMAFLYATDLTGRGARHSKQQQQAQQQAAATVVADESSSSSGATVVVKKRPEVAVAPAMVPMPWPVPPPPSAAQPPQPPQQPQQPQQQPQPAAKEEAPVVSPAAPPAATVAAAAAAAEPAKPSSKAPAAPVAAAKAKASEGDKENRQQQPPPSTQARPSSAPAEAPAKPVAVVDPAAALAALSPEERLERAERELIAAARLHRSTLTAALSARQEMVGALAELWGKGDVARACKMAGRIHAGSGADKGRLTALADFFRAVDLEAAAGSSDGAGLTLELAAPLVPVAGSLLALDFENHVEVGLAMLAALLGLYADYAKEVLAVPAGARVDLSREERVAQCQAFRDAVAGTRARVEALPALLGARAAGKPVVAAAARVQGLVAGFLG